MRRALRPPALRDAAARLAALALCLAPSTLAAQDAEARRRALVDEATAVSAAGDHARAVTLLARAASMRATPALWLVLAREQRLAGRDLDAWESASRCVDAPAQGEVSVSAECRALVDALAPRVGRLRVVTPTPAPAGLRVQVDGAELDASRLASPLARAPGVARVTAVGADGSRWEATVTVTGGAEVTATLAPARPADPVVAPTPSRPASTALAGAAVGMGGVCARLVGGRVACWGATGARHAAALVEGVAGATAITTGWAHACAVLDDRRVRCWGDDAWGQRGDGDDSDGVVRGVAGAVALSAGDSHTCALLDDGAVRCWGANSGGQLGDGTNAPCEASVAVQGLAPAAQVACAVNHACARLRDGTAACWGNNSARQVSAARATWVGAPARVEGVDRLVQLAAAGDAVCGLRDDGTVRCWGESPLAGVDARAPGARATQVPGLADVVELAAGREHVCARRRDGAVWCWGDATRGTLGVGRAAGWFAPRRIVGLPPAASIVAGGFTTCAEGRDGALRCWGSLPPTRPQGDARVVLRPERVRLPGARP